MVNGSGQVMTEWQAALVEKLDQLTAAQSLNVVKEAYTTEEVAKRLHRSEWTVRNWCNKGQVKGARKVRGNGRTGEWRISHEAVLHLQSHGPAPVGTHSTS
jgi:transposase